MRGSTDAYVWLYVSSLKCLVELLGLAFNDIWYPHCVFSLRIYRCYLLLVAD